MSAPPTRLSLVRHLRAPPGRVFAAWTDPLFLAQWFGPHRTHVEAASCDPRPGGRLRVVIVEDADVRGGAGTRHEANGVFLVVEPPARLVFDWFWGAAPDRVSRVSVAFRAVEGGTKLSLVHDRFADAETALRHTRGWTESLDRLVATLAPLGGS